GLRELDGHVDTRHRGARDPGTALVVVDVQPRTDLPALAQRKGLHQPPHLSVAEESYLHSKILGSSFWKKMSCRLRTACGIRSSAPSKVRLMVDAPCEIMWMFTSETALKTRCATPGMLRRLSPTQQTIALPPSTFTSPIFFSSVTTSQSVRVSSSVRDTLT